MAEQGRQLVDLLALERMPELAAALRQCHNRVIERWQDAVTAILPDADPLTIRQVRDSIPIVLEHLATTLESDSAVDTERYFEVTQAHGLVRFQHHYNVRELIIEYRLLRRITVEELQAELGDRLSVRSVQAVSMGVDIAMQQAVVTFVAKQAAMLRAAGESQARYLSFLSHDLRNNLNAVMLTLEVLARRLQASPGFDPELQEIAALQQSLTDTVRGMDRLLQAERLRHTEVHLHRAPVDLERAIRDVANHFRRAADEKGLCIETTCPPKATIESDRDLLAVILQNLVGNAVKFSTKGTIRIEATPPPDDKRGWVVSICDQGPGIPPEQVGKIFAEFARGETYGQEGVGLGLTIAARAARALGASITLESKVGVGSTFELVFGYKGPPGSEPVDADKATETPRPYDPDGPL